MTVLYNDTPTVSLNGQHWSDENLASIGQRKPRDASCLCDHRSFTVLSMETRELVQVSLC